MTVERVVWDQGARADHVRQPQRLRRRPPADDPAGDSFDRERLASTGERCDVLFVLEGSGQLTVDGEDHALEAESGIYVPPRREYKLTSLAPPRWPWWARRSHMTAIWALRVR